jgi:hypothetical protein
VTAGPAGNDRGMTSPHQDQPLAAREGLNEGSADSTAETAGVPAPLDQLVGDPTDSTAVAHGPGPVGLHVHRLAGLALRDDAGPGQQLEAGEG